MLEERTMGSRFQSLWRVWSSGTARIPHIWVMVLCVLTLIGCGAAVDGQRAAALQRWQAQPIAHYRLNTREVVGSHGCAQVAESRIPCRNDSTLEKAIQERPNTFAAEFLVIPEREVVERFTPALEPLFTSA
jgi:hypothetical protein